ncbi:MAG: endonuclease III [Candidatus Gracilibacteria bacterium]|nr:endonuclease III [Candidatus Gracilibacteria bacterium]
MRLKTSKENTEIIRAVQHIYDGVIIELDYETPFQLLCAVILSAQATDKGVNRTTPPLFERVKYPEDMKRISLDEVTELVKRINYFRNKAKFIHQTGIILAEKFGGIIPNDLKLIQTLPGVGIKTAKVVLSVLYDQPFVGVDTHIHRVCNRIGIVKTPTPEKTDKAIEKRLTLEQRKNMHHPFVLFGRYQCLARNPKCRSCVLKEWCNFYANTSMGVTSTPKTPLQ